jgi:hypothetical protein
MYDYQTGERLPVAGSDANAWGNAVQVGTVEVLPSVGVGDVSGSAP